MVRFYFLLIDCSLLGISHENNSYTGEPQGKGLWLQDRENDRRQDDSDGRRGVRIPLPEGCKPQAVYRLL